MYKIDIKDDFAKSCINIYKRQINIQNEKRKLLIN